MSEELTRITSAYLSAEDGQQEISVLVHELSDEQLARAYELAGALRAEARVELEARVRGLASVGHSQASIARVFGVGSSTVTRWYVELGIQSIHPANPQPVLEERPTWAVSQPELEGSVEVVEGEVLPSLAEVPVRRARFELNRPTLQPNERRMRDWHDDASDVAERASLLAHSNAGIPLTYRRELAERLRKIADVLERS